MSRNLQATPGSSGIVVTTNPHRPGPNDPRKQAETLTRSLRSLRRQGACHQIQDSAEDIAQIAALTKKAGHPRLAARLYLELARVFHLFGRLEEASDLLQAAIKTEDFIGEEILREIGILRSQIALDRHQLAEARRLVREATRPLPVGPAAINPELINRCEGAPHRGGAETGERIGEADSEISAAASMLEAEIMMTAGKGRAAAAALARAHQTLIQAEVTDHKADDMAMLSLLRALSPERPHRVSPEILMGLAKDWAEKGAGAPVIARMRAAAGDQLNEEEILRAINRFELARFRRLGELARSSRNGFEHSDLEGKAGSLHGVATLTNDETEGLFNSIREKHSHGMELLKPERANATSARQDEQVAPHTEAGADRSAARPFSTGVLRTSSALSSTLVDALSRVLEAQDIDELAFRVTESAEAFGASRALTRILIGERPATLACYPGREDEASPRIRLVETPSTGAANLRVRIEAACAPPEEYLTGLSVLARTALALAERLPAVRKLDLATHLADEDAGAGFIWASPAMFDVRSRITQLARMDGITLPIASVLITGETGTGKDKVARHIHDCSGRRHHPFVTVNCAAIPKDLFESEIFGHKKGSFTGAMVDKPGLIEAADGGTIFFTEFGEVPLQMQAKLLTVLDTDGQYTRVGEAHKIRHAHVRFIFATNRNVCDREVFRFDIFNRCPGKIHLEPLRHRREDIPVLARHFAEKFGLELTEAAIAYLQTLDWPGNVRELRSALQMATGKGEGPVTVPPALRWRRLPSGRRRIAGWCPALL